MSEVASWAIPEGFDFSFQDDAIIRIDEPQDLRSGGVDIPSMEAQARSIDEIYQS